MNLKPARALVHVWYLSTPASGDCTVTFTCNGMAGESVTWDVSVPSKTISAYWPSKTAVDGSSASLRAALITAGKSEEEANRRITCEVESISLFVAQGYTQFGGETWIPVTRQIE